MSPAPNQALRDLEALIGSDAARQIAGVFLDDFPRSMDQLRSGPPADHMRIAHGLRSSALHMGAADLSRRLEALEERLRAAGGPATEREISEAEALFEGFAGPLRAYAAG